ncbi:hypothetical protein FRC12_018806 [Ceratobasidium sp. 428]|nr:hypothetical protein FRC12_018806 [Ceratobasidium sp. 428]
MSEVPDQFDGKVITNAHFVTQDGQAEAFENALKEIQKYALSDKEPGMSYLLMSLDRELT